MQVRKLSTYMIALVLLLAPACDRSEAPGGNVEEAEEQQPSAEDESVAAGAVEARVVASSTATIDLDAVAELVVDGRVDSAESLEVLLNDPDTTPSVDLDGDGAVEPLQVVELEADGVVALEIRAVPSSTNDVEDAVAIATIEIVQDDSEAEIEVRAAQSAELVVTRRVRVEYRAGAVVHAPAPFVVWAFRVDRPLYYGVYVREHRGVRIPPGHVKHGHWKATGGKPGRSHGGAKIVVSSGPAKHSTRSAGKSAKVGKAKKGKGKKG